MVFLGDAILLYSSIKLSLLYIINIIWNRNSLQYGVVHSVYEVPHTRIFMELGRGIVV